MASNKDMTVLIIDSQKTMLRILRSMLTQLGFRNIEEATDGLAAMNLMRVAEYGLVICDADIEPMTGLQLLKTIRADKRLQKIPFIMIASDAKPADVMTAKKEGVSNFMLKPFNADTLKSKISAVIGPI